MNLNSIFNLLVRWRWMVVAFWLVFTIVASIGLKDLRFDADYRVFFDKDNPQLLAYDTMQGKYTTDDAVIIGVKRDQGIFSKNALEAVKNLTQKAWSLPHASRVDSLANYMHSQADEDALVVAELIGQDQSLTSKEIKRIKQIAQSESMIIGNLVSEDGSLALIRIVFRLPSTDPEVVLKIKADAQKILEEEQAKPEAKGLDLLLSGNIIAGIAFAEASQKDLGKLVPIMGMVMTIILTLMFRNILAMTLTMMAVALSALITMGLVGWTGMAISATTASAPISIMTLAVADSIHLLSAYLRKLENHGKIDALDQAFRANSMPIFITSITTAIGFLSMNLNDVPPFRELGNIVAIGVMVAFVMVLTLTPAIILLVPESLQKLGRTRIISEGQGGKMVGHFGAAMAKHRNLVLIAGVLFTVIGAYGMSKLEVNDSPVGYFSPTIPFRADTDVINDRIGGFETLEYSLKAEGDNGIFEPDYLKKIEAFAQYGATLPGVTKVVSLAEVMKKLNKNMNQDEQTYYKIPESREEAAQYFLLYELSLPFGRDLTDLVTVSKSESRITFKLSAMSTKGILGTIAKLDQWLKTEAPEMMTSSATSMGVVFANIYWENIGGMLEGTGLALLLITVVMLMIFRGSLLGLLSLIPNVIPIIWAFGFWGWYSGKIDLASSGIAMMAIGIIVDDTVHFLTKYNIAIKAVGGDPALAVEKTFSEVGRALIVTSVVLCFGFLILAASEFKLNQSIGVLTTACIVFALLADFFVLPALLLLSRNTATKNA